MIEPRLYQLQTLFKHVHIRVYTELGRIDKENKVSSL